MSSTVKNRLIWSFFTGAGGLDLGFEAAGLAPSLSVELDKNCRETLKLNRPDILLADTPRNTPGDIAGITGRDLRSLTGEQGDVYLLIGGPPCQSFSTGGKRAALSDPRGNLIYHYLRLIGEIRPQLFVLENVANLLTAAIRHRPISDRPGQHWSLKKYDNGTPKSDDDNAPLDEDEMSGSAIRLISEDINKLGYSITLGVLNSADYGCAQKRLRLFILGCRDGNAPPLPSPTHFDPLSVKKPSYRTLRDMIWDLQDDPGPHSVYTEQMAQHFRLVPAGGNWRDLPEAIKPLALGNSFSAGGGKTGFFRRLSWDKPAPTIIGRANRKGSAICHPLATRPLSVSECARLQGFPDDWVFSGSMSSQYLQVGNAVPVPLGTAVGAAIHDAGGGRVVSDNLSLERQIEIAVKCLRSSARNHKAHARMFSDATSPLFDREG